MIWRDDDVLWQRYGLDHLLRVDDTLQRAGVVHTVAVIASTLTAPVARVLLERRMSVQLHCWTHDDLSANPKAIAELPQAVQKIEDLVGIRPTVLYPPWNRTSAVLDAVAAALGLTVSAHKISLEQYIRCDGDVRESVINFHYWHEPDRVLLDEALAIYARRHGRAA